MANLIKIADSMSLFEYKIDPSEAETYSSHLSSKIYKIDGEIADKLMHRRNAVVYNDAQATEAPLAIAATYLKIKKGLSNFFVCDSIEAFEAKAREIQNSPKDVRAAIIVYEDEEHELFGDETEWFKHYYTICFEKVGSSLKIVVIDANPDLPDTYLLENFSRGAEIYFSAVKRQHDGASCSAFALRDSVSFLEDPQFFSKIQTKKCNLEVDKAIYSTHKITALPPAFMKSNQSLTTIKSYIATYPGDTTELKDSIERHTYRCSKKKSDQRNYYITERFIKYKKLAGVACKTLPIEEVQSIISETLLTTPPAKRAKL